ncbi:M20 family metallo-hydrolase [Synergistaceae bacterium OttesenSCG-928-D05]|nr:M20 family metallo-hydrolase [Synergistaceae bacterium OttesenSCG-928-D05]
MKEKIFSAIDALEPQMIDTLSGLVAIPAVSPLDGGEGEYDKAQYLAKKVEELGLGKPEIYNSNDPTAKNGVRPNLIVKIPGKSEKRLWVMSHMDVVPEGDRSLWDTDPFKAVVKDGRIYGRGSSDNGQELVASLYAAAALKKLGVTPAYEVYLAFVADEEVGSLHGIQYLIKEGLFRKDDLVIVPDGGNEKGDFIEVAEKSIAWLEFEVTGEQVHASMPQLGKNACRVANELSVALDEALHNAFPETDELFAPSVSTFEPTRRNKNVANVNTVPGREIFCFDCRVLPHVQLSDVMKVVESVVKKTEEKHGVRVEVRKLQYEQAPAPTPVDAPIVKLLEKALPQVLDVKPVVGGVGGGTCAAYLRQVDIPAVVWVQEADVAHMPNEYSVIEYMKNECKIFALMMADE